ncbi:hypothetical protein [Actinophytocola oryzae]|uniref:Serine peptidase n=1 Tax=Actinophytocola oryzae TaxID=502181 RepID=A0A4V3FQA0_9PSEU|nr:hypothetical protein [Actinophytocola oryzae]TDV36831.1 hypothetical protein CLV71_13037 [Actinophytocola oryzae]
MALAVGVHGIGQHRVSPGRLADRWRRALGRADVTFELAYYAHLYSGHSGRLGDDEPDSAEQVPSEAEIEFVAEVLSDVPDTEGVGAEELGPPALWPSFVNRALVAVDRRWGRSAGGVLLRCVRQVYRYLSHPALAEEIRGVVTDTIAGRPGVVVAHSLGSVVVFDALTRGLLPPGTSLVTIGSPLSWPTIRRRIDGGSPPEGCSWHNFHDLLDVVTGGHGLGPAQAGVVDHQVSNGWLDPHAAVRYLRQPSVADAVLPGRRTPR